MSAEPPPTPPPTPPPQPTRQVPDDLMASVYDELRRLAGGYLGRQAPGHTLQPTALVHEAWLKLARPGHSPWNSRTHFVAAAARTMRHVLVNHAAARGALKRGGAGHRLELDDALALYEGRCLDLLDLDRALGRLAELDPRQAEIVELRFVGGLSLDETAGYLGVSGRTVEREWRTARAWLRTEIDADTPGDHPR